ncbi:hypothetical protein GC173_12325 [bacterium]|nr:hypothetical protein [bacterium]
MKTLFASAAILLVAAMTHAEEAPAPAATLPEGLKWQTNWDDPPIGDPEHAIKGGTLRDAISSYPKTFRVIGPNSNEMWANWRRNYTEFSGLVGRHPNTDNYIPALAVEWAITDDNKSVYYRLDPTATWSDGKPITADDFVFGYQTALNPGILDPFVNQYTGDVLESVEKIDTHTIKVTGRQPSWRVLEDLGIFPLPAHVMKIEPGWEVATNYHVPVTAGPYTIGESKEGESVTLVRNPNWWGYKNKYYAGLYNADKIVVRVVPEDDRVYDFFKRGELDFIQVNRARRWATEMDIDIFKRGYAARKMLFTDTPDGMSGIGMNLNTPILKNKDFRKALQYMFNFEELNTQLMFNAYFRKVSAFDGTEFANPDLKPYGFDPRKAREHLQKAGFTQRGADGILVNKAGQRASVTLMTGGKSLEAHLNIVQNTYKKAGIELKIQSLEGATYFEKIREKASEAFMLSMTGGFYPEPFQYFNSTQAKEPQTNNFFAFSNPRADELIDIYRFDMDKQKRLDAMHELDAMIQDEAFYIPFWNAPFIRFAYYRWIEFPADYFPKRTESYLDYPTYWINEQKKADIEAAMKENRVLAADPVIEVDPHGVKPK